MGLKIGGWLGGAWERNRDAAGKTLKALAPLAAFIPGVGIPLAAAIGAGAGALGTAAQRGTNIGDILKGGAASGAAAGGAKYIGGLKPVKTFGSQTGKIARSIWSGAPEAVVEEGAKGAARTGLRGILTNPAVIGPALEQFGQRPKTLAEAEQAYADAEASRATAERTRGATALDAFDLEQKRKSDAALNEMLKRIRSGGM